MENAEYLKFRENQRAKDAEKRRERRKKNQDLRYKFLASMTRDDRFIFLENEKKEKEILKNQLLNATTNGQRIAIDLQYPMIMNQKERTSLVKQIVACYGLIKKMHNPFSLTLSNCTNELDEALNRVEYKKWQIIRSVKNIEEIFPINELVYLSPDSPNLLDVFDKTKVYVLGGIVDKSRRKGETLATAERLGIETARLPIQEHIKERLDHILNVNTVLEVLANFQSTNNWKLSLEKALPPRKQNTVGNRSLKKCLKNSISLKVDSTKR